MKRLEPRLPAVVVRRRGHRVEIHGLGTRSVLRSRCANVRNNRGVVIKYSLLIAVLLMVVTGCAGTEPRIRSGVPYSEEIKAPVPRDTLLFGADCVVR